MKAVLVGEAWGKNEARMQHPLVGASGRELTLELGAAKFAPHLTLTCRKCKRETEFHDSRCEHCRNHVWPNEFDLIAHWKRLRAEYGIAVTNVFNTQPPNNDVGHFFGTEPETELPPWKATGGSHLKVEHLFHLARLWREIGDLKPNLIVALGNAACWATLGQTKITMLRGTVALSQRLNVKVLPTFHPAAVLRNYPLRVTTIADFQKAAREMEFPEIRRPERWITVIDPTNEGIEDGYAWFRRPATAYANDIETNRGQITIVGFARARGDALVIPFRIEDFKEPNYWPTEELEFAAWKLVIHGLQTPQPKIFQNGLYDMSYYLRMGILPRNVLHDTMLWHHSLYPELPKALGYLGSIYGSDISWKQMRRQETLKRDE